MRALSERTILLFVLALALSGCVINNTTNPPQIEAVDACSSGAVTTGFTNFWASWQALCVFAAFTVFLVSILAYSLGYALNHQKAIIWAREQMREAILAMFIALFVIGFVSFLCGLNLDSLGMGSGNFVDVGFSYLNTMYSRIMEGYLVVIAINSVMSWISTMTIGFAPGSVGPVFAPFAFLGDIANSMVVALIALMTSAIIMLTQMILLKMTASLFSILFPVGIILRSFGITRGFGGGLMAIAIGFFIFYPLLIVIFYGAVAQDISNSYNGLTDSFQNAGPSPSSPSWFSGMIDYITGFVGGIVMAAIFIPLVMFMVLIGAIKGLSMALGEEVDVSNLTRLI